jgi:hypothetical protein
MIEKRNMWKWFVRGDATSYMPSTVVVVTNEAGFCCAVAHGAMLAEGFEDLTVYESESALLDDYSPEPLIREQGYYTPRREAIEREDRQRGLLVAAQRT